MTHPTSLHLSVDTIESIHELESSSWNDLAGADDFYQSHEWLATVERDSTARARYLLVWLGGQLAGALPLYRVEFEASPVYHGDRLRSLLGVTGRYLVAGSRRCYRANVMLAPGLPDAVADEVTAALLRSALVEADRQGAAGVAMFFVPTPTLRRIGRATAVIAAFDAAETTLDGIGAGIAEFVSRQSSKLRAKVRREMRAFAATSWRTEVTGLAEYLPEVAALVGNVEQRHGHATPDILLRRIYRRQVEAVEHRAVVLSCRDGDGGMVACAVNYAWRDTLYSRAVGLDYDRLAGSFAYFNLLIYQAVGYAAEHGLERLHLGLASAAKMERGAVASPLWTIVARSDTCADPGVRIVDPEAMRRWMRPYSCYAHAFSPGAWSVPQS